MLANIESGRRSYVTVAELLTLAYVLDVAPVHLLVPTEVDEDVSDDQYAICPDVFLPIPHAREWVRGNHAPGCGRPTPVLLRGTPRRMGGTAAHSGPA